MIRNLILIGLLFLTSPASAGIALDAADDSLSCGTSDTMMTENGAVTISAWVKPTSVGEGSNGRIIGREPAASNGHFRFILTSTSTIGFSVQGGTTLVATASNASITTGAYQHVLVTWDGVITTANSVHIYVNGVETTYKTQTNGATATDNSADAILIGNSPDGTRTFDGIIDEIAVWNTVLSAQSIANLANAKGKRLPLQISPSNLKAYWVLDEEEDGSSADGDTFIDISGNGNNCTGSDGANNTGLTASAGAVQSYP